MYTFERQHIVANGPSCTVWRERGLVGVQIRGRIGLVESNAWRTALAAECAARGHPRFLAFDMADSVPAISVAQKTGVAYFLVSLMKRVEWAALHTRRSETPTTVVSAVLRLVHIRNVTVTQDDEAFCSAVAAFRRGHPPA